MAKHTKVHTSSKGELTASQTVTDAPLLPIGQLVTLQQVAPDKVDWIFQQTEIEADHRRREQTRLNTLVFVERMCSLIFALVIVLFAFSAAIYLALHGHDHVALIIASGGLVYIVSTFLNRNKS